jgi:hypothetical protein
VKDIDCLFLSNGLYADIAYQEVNKTYEVEVEEGNPVKIAKDKWIKTDSS